MAEAYLQLGVYYKANFFPKELKQAHYAKITSSSVYEVPCSGSRNNVIKSLNVGVK